MFFTGFDLNVLPLEGAEENISLKARLAANDINQCYQSGEIQQMNLVQGTIPRNDRHI